RPGRQGHGHGRDAPRGEPRMTAIADTFTQRGEKGGGAKFVAYLTAGDPSLDVTPELLRALVAGGADLIELGVPFTDPMADGPVLQRAAGRAIRAGTSLARVLEMVASERASLPVPIVLFGYYNP